AGPILYREVIRGFVIDAGRSRWLTHREISQGVLEAIRADRPRSIVGTVTPWPARPQRPGLGPAQPAWTRPRDARRRSSPFRTSHARMLPDTVDTRKPGTKASTPTARPMTRCATGTEARAPRIPVPMISPAMAAP